MGAKKTSSRWADPDQGDLGPAARAWSSLRLLVMAGMIATVGMHAPFLHLRWPAQVRRGCRSRGRSSPGGPCSREQLLAEEVALPQAALTLRTHQGALLATGEELVEYSTPPYCTSARYTRTTSFSSSGRQCKIW